MKTRVLVAITLTGIVAGTVVWLLGAAGLAGMLWALTTAAMLVPLAWTVISGALLWSGVQLRWVWTRKLYYVPPPAPPRTGD